MPRRSESWRRPSGSASRKWKEIAVTKTAARVATSRAACVACTVSAWRPAVRATMATSASRPARRWYVDSFSPERSRAWVSMKPTSAHTTVRANATASTGFIPPGTTMRTPTTTPAIVSASSTTWTSRNHPSTGAPVCDSMSSGGSATSSFTSPGAVTVIVLRSSSLDLRTAWRRGWLRPRRPRSARRACARSAPQPLRPRGRA